jgi:hypothetical protein
MVPDMLECYKQQQQQQPLLLMQQQQQQSEPSQPLACNAQPLQQQEHYAFLPPTFRQVPGLLLHPEEESAGLPSGSSSQQQPHHTVQDHAMGLPSFMA